ncbi:MAG: lactate utilization protein C [Haliscomenobacter sp.]
MSKESILAAIRRNQPEARPLPDPPVFNRPGVDVLAHFCQMVHTVGGNVLYARDLESADTLFTHYYPLEKSIASTCPDYPGTVDWAAIAHPLDLETVDLAIVSARLGVAENGAVWVTEADCGHRVLPFIAQHLLIVLDMHQIVPDMHTAYQSIRIDETGFGAFIAGPSKTADIEQALVIGAQGARSLTVLLR